MVTYLSGVQEPLVRVQIPHPDFEEVIAVIKRLFCLLSAVMVSASSVFAWDAYSFTGVYNAPSIPNLALAETASAGNPMIDLTDPALVWDTNKQFSIGARGNYAVPGQSFETVMPEVLTGVAGRNGIYVQFSGTTSFNSSIFTPHDLLIPYLSDASTLYWTYHFSEPYPESISLDAHILPYLNIAKPTVSVANVSMFDVYINNSLVGSYYPDSDHYISISDIYTNYSGIQSIKFVPFFNQYTYDMDMEEVDYWFQAVLYQLDGSALFKIGVLSDNSALDGEIGSAQDNINDLDSVESEWTGSMTSNFDALDLGNFSFPSGLVSGFALITGIFQDLWNSMGEYKILFVFPLTLGVVLLLIGRISKFSGGHSSRSSGRSDDA